MRKFIEKFNQKNIDYIFIIKGEVVPVDLLERIKNKMPQIKIILYLWDSIANSSNAKTLLQHVDRVLSFDRDDCTKYGFFFRSMFYMEADDNAVVAQRKDTDVLFVGTAHTDRYRIVKEIESQLVSRGHILQSYFYLQSPVVFIYKMLFEKGFSRIPHSDISYEPLSRKDLLDLIYNSNTILDIHHPKQTGLTQRPFEALGAGKKLITTNTSIKEYDFYHENNILIIDRKKPTN